MKISALIFFLILPIANTFTQWTFDTTMPVGATYPPIPLQICIIDSSVSWILGNTNTNPNPFYPYLAKRTADGWKEITQTDLSSDVHGRSIAARDSNTAWLGTSWPETIYFTSNGGANWVLRCYISDTAYVEGIMFSKTYPDIGYAFASIGHFGMWYGARILKTTNSGLNWNRWEFELYEFMPAQNSMAVIDSNYAWFGLNNVLGGQSKVIMTSNGGISWNIYDVNGGFAGPNAIQFSSDKKTGLYGSPDNISYIYRTTNSGINWSQIYYVHNYSYFNTMRWVTETCNIYANTSDYVLRSVNNGLNWSYMTGINSTQLVSMDAVRINDGTIYALAVSNTRNIYKLLDTVRPIGIENPRIIIPGEYNLYQNYPNPFNPVTIIKFDLPKSALVKVKIYDILGRVVDILIKDEIKKAGSYNVIWDASKFPSGVYFYMMETGDFVSSKKMILIK